MSSKTCGHSVPCGCGDTPLTSKPSCGNSPCPEPDLCPETFCDGCVVHCGDTIVGLGIEQGMRLDVILQQLALNILMPSCAQSGNPCNAPLGLASSNVMSTTMDVSWLPITTAVQQYEVEYKLASSASWSLNGPIVPVGGETLFTDSIIGLIPDTEYHVRVLAVCSNTEACYSVTILVKTKN